MAGGVTPYMPVVNPYVKPYDPNSASGQPATPQASTGNYPPVSANNGMQTPQASTSSPVPATPSNAAYVQIPSAKGATVPNMPQYGYGGGDYNKLGSQEQQDMVANANRLQTDAGYRDFETNRTNQVIAARQGQGMDTTDQQNYLGTIKGYTPIMAEVKPGAGVTSNGGNGPTPPGPATPSIYTPLSSSEIAAMAKARIDQQRAGISQAVDYAKTGLKNTYDYTQGRLQDQRNLETNQFQRDHSPFNGNTDYLAADMLRNRNIADTASGNQYNAAVSAENQKLSSFDALAPEQQQQIYDGLLQQERKFGLDKGQLTGWLDNQRTLAGQTSDQSYQLGLSGLSGQLPASAGGGQTQQAQAQGFNQNLQTQEFAYKQARDAIGDEQYKQKFDRDTQQFGLDYALKQATLANQISSEAANRAISQQNANTSATNATNSASNANQSHLYEQWKITGKAPAGIPGVDVGTAYTGMDKPGVVPKNQLESQYVSNIEKMTPENRAAFFKNEKSAIVNDLGLPGYTTLYNSYFDQYGTPK